MLHCHFPTMLKSVYDARFSVWLSVCAHSNSRKYSSNILKLIYIICVWRSMRRIENGTLWLLVCLQRQTKGFRYITAYGWGKCSKHILTYSYYTKSNEINIYHWNIQKKVSYEKWYKKYKYFLYKLTQKFSHTLHSTVKFFKEYFNTFILNEI